MQIARTTPLAAGTPDLARIPDANRVLAEARIRLLDREDAVTFTSHLQLVAGGRLGARAGYATLGDAIGALSELTRGERVAGAAVLERGGRFYGHALKGRDLEQGLRAPLRRTYLEPDARARVLELRTTGRVDRLLALVDGAWTHRFRGPGRTS